MTNSELSKALHIHLTSVRMKLYSMGLKRMELEYWSKEQVRFLKSNFKKMGDVEIAEIFQECYYKKKGWTYKHIRKKRIYLCLHRTEEQIEAVKERNVMAGRYSVNHWKRWFGMRTPVGSVHTWKHQSGRPFKAIKLKKGFVHYAPWLWKQKNGKIPKGHVIGFRDKDPLNVVPENLICITRAEHARRNRIDGYDEFPEDLKQSIRLLSELNKQLKNVNKKQNSRSKQPPVLANRAA